MAENETPEIALEAKGGTIKAYNNVKSPEFHSIYVNNTSFAMNAFDISMTFGEIDEVNDTNSVATVNQKIRVVMSPLHAKILMFVLGQNLQNFEKTFGSIKLPVSQDGVITSAIGNE